MSYLITLKIDRELAGCGQALKRQGEKEKERQIETYVKKEDGEKKKKKS